MVAIQMNHRTTLGRTQRETLPAGDGDLQSSLLFLFIAVIDLHDVGSAKCKCQTFRAWPKLSLRVKDFLASTAGWWYVCFLD